MHRERERDRVKDNFKADMKSYVPIKTAAIFFSSEPFSKTGYYIFCSSEYVMVNFI